MLRLKWLKEVRRKRTLRLKSRQRPARNLKALEDLKPPKLQLQII
jgi:hypothetical protein